jgi:hypothetical protein
MKWTLPGLWLKSFCSTMKEDEWLGYPRGLKGEEILLEARISCSRYG